MPIPLTPTASTSSTNLENWAYMMMIYLVINTNSCFISCHCWIQFHALTILSSQDMECISVPGMRHWISCLGLSKRHCRTVVNHGDSRARLFWVQVYIQLLTSCIVVGKSHKLTAPYFSDLENGINHRVYLIGLLWGGNEIVYVKHRPSIFNKYWWLYAVASAFTHVLSAWNTLCYDPICLANFSISVPFPQTI